jgi:hypothetical protein
MVDVTSTPLGEAIAKNPPLGLEKLGQLGDVHSNSSRLIFAEQLSCRGPAEKDKRSNKCHTKALGGLLARPKQPLAPRQRLRL